MPKKYFGILVAVLAVLLVVFGFFRASDQTPENTPPDSSAGIDAPLTDDWTFHTNEEYGIRIAHPLEFEASANETRPANTWRINSADPGENIANIHIPPSFEPNTNFLDANFNIGLSRNPHAIEECFTPDPSGPNNASGTAENINNVGYIKFLSTGAGAGNIYETMSWRTIREGTCYAFEGIIHSTHVENYPAEENRKEFDRTRIRTILEEMMKTASFL